MTQTHHAGRRRSRPVQDPTGDRAAANVDHDARQAPRAPRERTRGAYPGTEAARALLTALTAAEPR